VLLPRELPELRWLAVLGHDGYGTEPVAVEPGSAVNAMIAAAVRHGGVTSLRLEGLSWCERPAFADALAAARHVTAMHVACCELSYAHGMAESGLLANTALTRLVWRDVHVSTRLRHVDALGVLQSLPQLPCLQHLCFSSCLHPSFMLKAALAAALALEHLEVSCAYPNAVPAPAPALGLRSSALRRNCGTSNSAISA
jgi:hypothetical protein